MREARETQTNSYVCTSLFKYWRVTRSHTPSASIYYVLRKHEHPDMKFYNHLLIANHLLVPVWRKCSPPCTWLSSLQKHQCFLEAFLKIIQHLSPAVCLRDGEPQARSRCCSSSAHSNNSQSLVVQQPQTSPLGGFLIGHMWTALGQM